MADHSKNFNKVTKLDPKTGEPIKKDVKEEVEELDEGKMKDIYTDMMYHATKKGYSSHKEFTSADYDTVGKQHGISGKELAVIAGHKTAQQADTHFKKPVEPGKGMDRAKALAQRGMQSLSKEEVERLEEKLTQIDELSKGTLSSYVKRSANQAIIKSLANPKDDSDDMKTIAKREKGINLATSKLSKEEVERIEEKLAQLGEGTYKHEVEKSFPASGVKTGDSAPKGTTYMPKDKEKAKGKPAGSIGEEVEQEMSPYLKGTLKVMDEGKIDNLRDAQKLRQDMQSAYDKDYKPDTSHPHIQVVKGTAYGGENQKDDEGDEKPDETKEKKGRGRPAGSKSGARQKGGGHEDGGIPVHNLNLPKSYK
jgi:hypothetical protein